MVNRYHDTLSPCIDIDGDRVYYFLMIAETRLNVRLKGVLAEYVDNLLGSSLYESHSEYVRDLIRRDMGIQNYESDAVIREKIVNGFTQLGNGEYDDQPLSEIWEEARAELKAEAGIDA